MNENEGIEQARKDTQEFFDGVDKAVQQVEEEQERGLVHIGEPVTVEHETVVEPEHIKIPGVDCASMSVCLGYVLRACPKEKEQPLLSHVTIVNNTDRKCLEFHAHDGTKWFSCRTDFDGEMQSIQLSKDCASTLRRDCENAFVRASGFARVTFDTGSKLRWNIHYGEPEPMPVTLSEFDPGKFPAKEDFEAPGFVSEETGLVTTALTYDAKAITRATNWEGSRVASDRVDNSGRKHIVLVDKAGVQLARAVICPVGITDGLPKEKQTEIPGTQSPVVPKEEAPKNDWCVLYKPKGKQKTVCFTGVQPEAESFLANFTGSPGGKLYLQDPDNSIVKVHTIAKPKKTTVKKKEQKDVSASNRLKTKGKKKR